MSLALANPWLPPMEPYDLDAAEDRLQELVYLIEDKGLPAAWLRFRAGLLEVATDCPPLSQFIEDFLSDCEMWGWDERHDEALTHFSGFDARDHLANLED